MKRSLVVRLGAIMLATQATAWAEPRVYEGVYKDGGSSVPLLLTIDAQKGLGDRAGSINFKGQWRCGFDLEYGGLDSQVSAYSLAGAGKGRCVVLENGQLQSKPAGDDLGIELFDRADKSVARLKLTPRSN